MKQVQAFMRILGYWSTFIPHLMQCLHPLYCLLKKRHVWDWGTEQQAAFEKAKVLVEQIKALGIAQVELPSELDILVTRKVWGGDYGKNSKRRVPFVFWSKIRKWPEIRCPPKQQLWQLI